MAGIIMRYLVEPYLWVFTGLRDFVGTYGILGALSHATGLDAGSSFLEWGIVVIAIALVLDIVAIVLAVVFGLNRTKWDAHSNRSGFWFAVALVLTSYLCGKMIAPYLAPYSSAATQSQPMSNALLSGFLGLFSWVSAFMGLLIALLVNKASDRDGTHAAWIAVLLAMPPLVAAFGGLGVMAVSAGFVALAVYACTPIVFYIIAFRLIARIICN